MKSRTEVFTSHARYYWIGASAILDWPGHSEEAREALEFLTRKAESEARRCIEYAKEDCKNGYAGILQAAGAELALREVEKLKARIAERFGGEA